MRVYKNMLNFTKLKQKPKDKETNKNMLKFL